MTKFNETVMELREKNQEFNDCKTGVNEQNEKINSLTRENESKSFFLTYFYQK